LRELVAHLRVSGQLTPSLVVRALLSGQRDLFEAALAELSGLPDIRVAGQLRDFRGAGFAALYAKSGLPEKYLPAFRAALEAQRELGENPRARLSIATIRRVLIACEAINRGELDPLLALLRRYELEAALDEARLAAPMLAESSLIAQDAQDNEAPAIDMLALDAAIAVEAA